MKKNKGIWLDKEKAYIVSLKNNLAVIKTITSNIEDFHIGGGSGTKFKVDHKMLFKTVNIQSVKNNN